jgi:hypothetical protein
MVEYCRSLRRFSDIGIRPADFFAKDGRHARLKSEGVEKCLLPASAGEQGEVSWPSPWLLRQFR